VLQPVFYGSALYATVIRCNLVVWIEDMSIYVYLPRLYLLKIYIRPW
jgi:hypothetical protein